MSADTTCIDKIFLIHFCNIFKIDKIGAIISNFAVYDVNLTTTIAKIPIFFSNIKTKKLFPSSIPFQGLSSSEDIS